VSVLEAEVARKEAALRDAAGDRGGFFAPVSGEEGEREVLGEREVSCWVVW
jgi:hypothetical protein